MPAVDAQLQPTAGLATAGQSVATTSVQDLQEAAALLGNAASLLAQL